VEKTDEKIENIEAAMQEYDSVSSMTTRIFFSLKNLGNVHYLYQYSLQMFMDMVFYVLKENEVLKKEKDPKIRLKIIITQLYLYINQTVGQGLKHEDQILFTLRLAQIKFEESPDCKNLGDVLLKPFTVVEPTLLPPNLLDGRLTPSQIGALEELSASINFQGLSDHLQQEKDSWIAMVEHQYAETVVPEPWMRADDCSMTNNVARILKKMIIIKVLRPDRLLVAVNQLLAAVHSEEIVSVSPVDLAEFAEPKISSKNPIMLVSSPGFDASYKVELLAKQRNKKLSAIAMGSPEAFNLVDEAIRKSSKSGQWVLLKNVHLVPAWLVTLEKKIYNMTLDKEFRLFMTMENNPRVPSTLFTASHVLVFEPPAGIKAALVRAYA
jgi:dynein heavy chain 1